MMVLLLAGHGAVFAAWHGGERDSIYRLVRGVEGEPRQLAGTPINWG